MSVKIIDKDLGWKRITAEAKKLDGSYALVGIQSEEGAQHFDGNPLSLAEIAVVNEFGTEIEHENGKVTRIPERSFMRGTIDAKRSKIVRVVQHQIGQVQAGKLSARQAVGQLGEFVVGEVKAFIGDRNNFEPNAPRTIAKKSRDGKIGDAPLIDQGNLIGSIRSKPVVGGAK